MGVYSQNREIRMHTLNSMISYLEDKFLNILSKFKQSYALVTFTLVMLNCAIFFAGYRPVASLDSMTSWVTYMFGHANLEHLMGNMLFLVAFGPRVELEFGRMKFLCFWLLCGIASALGFFLFMPDARLIGASGALSGVMAVYPFVKKDLLTKIIALIPVGFWFFMNMAAALNPFGARVAYLGHLAGGAMGVLFLAFSYTKSLKK